MNEMGWPYDSFDWECRLASLDDPFLTISRRRSKYPLKLSIEESRIRLKWGGLESSGRIASS